jgi:hypothetical protein
VISTIDRIESKKDKAVRFLRDVLEDEDRADEIEDESAEDYAERKGRSKNFRLIEKEN